MRRIHKCWAICLAFILTVSCLPATVFAAPADVDNNVKVTVNGYAWDYSGEKADYSGSGTEEDPFTWVSRYNSSKKDKLTVKANNLLSTINGQMSMLSGWSTPLAYGFNEIDFVVVSSDKTVTAYYHVTWERRKEMRQERVNKDSLYIVPATPGQSDGKIAGLDPTDVYDYRLKGATDWQTVSGAADISGLAAGTYQIKFGETDSQYAADVSWAIDVVLGDTSQAMEIRLKDPSLPIELPASAVSGERVAFRVRLDQDQWVQKVEVAWVNTGDWTSSAGVTCTFVDYTSDADGKYYNGYFLMPSYNQNRHVEVRGISYLNGVYHSIAKSSLQNATTTITPANPADTLTLNGELVYKQGSTVTIAVGVHQGFGTGVLKSFQVCGADGKVIADSPDGKPVEVTVTEDLRVENVVIEMIPADFTAMEEQLARVEGVNLYVYTDDTRVALELKLELAKQMVKLTQKDQKMVDDFVVELTAAIDGLIPKDGDFTAVEEWMAKIPEDLSVYTDETVAALTAAKEAAQVAVDEAWNRLRQEEIDDLADALAAAVEGLVYLPADYSAVDAAIEKAEALSPEEYVDFTAVQAAIDAVVRGKTIVEQAAVDEMAKAIEDAMAGLQKKPAPVDPEDPSGPQTGDTSRLPGYAALVLLAGGALALTRRRSLSHG